MSEFVGTQMENKEEKMDMDELLNDEVYNLKEEKSFDELIEVEEEADTKGTIHLKTPLVMNDEKIDEISYDFEKVKPIQYINLTKRLSRKKNIPVPELDADVKLGYFSLSSGVPVSDLKRLKNTKDLVKITSLVRDFLLD